MHAATSTGLRDLTASSCMHVASGLHALHTLKRYKRARVYGDQVNNVVWRMCFATETVVGMLMLVY